MQPIICPQCKANIPVEQLNPTQRTARCVDCQSSVPVTNPFSTKHTPAALYWPSLTLPNGFNLTGSGSTFTVTWRWFGSKYIFLIFFCLIWDLITFNLVGAAGWAALFIPHVWVAVGVTYYTLAGLVNHTEIRVDANQLTVTHGPLPYWGNKQFSSDTLGQLYSKKRTHRTKRTTTYTYELHAYTRTGRSVTLLKGLDKPQQALFLEQEIERFLDIKDKSIAGELVDPLAARHRIDWSGWQTLAQANNLVFSSGKLIEAFRVYGNYWGHILILSAYQRSHSQSKSLWTRLQLIQNQPSAMRPKKFPDPLFTQQDVSRLLKKSQCLPKPCSE